MKREQKWKPVTGIACLLMVVCMLVNSVVGNVIRPPLRAWDIHSRGIWRKEVRSRELARWYRHYNWVSVQRLWLNRRAEGVWVWGESLEQFTSRTHCVIQNPRGPGVWRIWRTFRRRDVRRFRLHYRVWWAGHLNDVVADNFPNADVNNPLNRRFCLALDHLEIVTPMEPQDPDPSTEINEAVQIMFVNDFGQEETHFLGEPGFEIMPDTEMNPNGYTLATTAISTEQLAVGQELINDFPPEPMPGMAEISPGVMVEWLMDDQGNVLVPDEVDPLSPRVLGNQKNQGLLAEPTGVEGNDLGFDGPGPNLALSCWLLDEEGQVLGAAPGEVVIGSPQAGPDVDGDQLSDPVGAFGGPIPMDPTVRDEHDEIHPDMAPLDLVVEEEGQPNPDELADLNERLIKQLPNFTPLRGPFKLCIRSIKVRSQWGIDRRVVMDTWYHHWYWRLRNHITLRRGLYRVWLSKKAISQFTSRHHHFVVGKPPVWRTYSRTHVRFFRICYRVYCPRPGVIRLKIDQLWMVVPMDPDNPQMGLMLVTTESNENALLLPAVQAGLEPDPIPFDDNGMFVEQLSPLLDSLDMGGGGAGIFQGNLDALTLGGMADVGVAGNPDQPDLVNNNQLQLYCWPLDAQGRPAVEVFGGAGTLPILFTAGPTPAIPVFVDDTTGEVMEDPTMIGLELALHPRADINLDGIINLPDLSELGRLWLTTEADWLANDDGTTGSN